MANTGIGGFRAAGNGLPRLAAGPLLVASALAWSGPTSADSSAYRVELAVFPSLGASTPVPEGWFSCFVKLANPGDTALSGIVELVSDGARRNVSSAPFYLAPRARVSVELPVRGFDGIPPSFVARALDDEGRVLGEQKLSDLRLHQPLLFDLEVPSRLALSLSGVPVASREPHARRGTATLAVQNPQINADTGDAALPNSAAGYASVTVVFARSEALAKISGPELLALGSWVLAGGALAVAMTRPEDLRSRALTAFVGGTIARSAAPAELAAGGRFELSGYAGGNLRPSRWGASASYGLGELHLLAFDAAREPFSSDEWVRRELVDLVAHAWQRRFTIALPHAQSSPDPPLGDRIRHELDPTESTRWSIAVSALLLVVYVAGVGPRRLYRSERGALRNLWLYPVLSILGFASIVVCGILGKGVLGRARRLTLVEAGAGMPRAAATRFRGFFTSSPQRLSVRSSDPSSVLEVAGDGAGSKRRLLVGRDGSRLEAFEGKPWRTTIVREDGFITLGGGLSLVPAPGGDVAIKNHLARDLVGVVVKPPGKPAVLLERVRDGQTLLASQGGELAPFIGRATRIGALAIHKLGADSFADDVERTAVGLGACWRGFEALAPDVDWWPSDVPVLIAQIEGGEGLSADSGMKIDGDRLLLRVVGWGGQ